MDERDRQRAFESRFLQQVEQRVRLMAGKSLPGKGIEVMPMPDGADAVRAALQRLAVDDWRGQMESLPGTRALQVGFRQGLLDSLSGKPRQRLRAQVLAPIAEILRGDSIGPLGRDAVLDAVARYEVLAQRAKPSVVVLGSATGFNDSARALVDQAGPPALVLVGGREDGGWDIHMSAALRKSGWAPVFSFETADERLKRLQYHLDRSGFALETSGVSLSELAEQVGLSQAEIERVVQQACRADSRLMIVRQDGQPRLCRSPMADEGRSMSVWSRIRRWLGFQPSIAERVREMTQQRVALEGQRSDIDKKVAEFEKQEREGLQAITAEPRVEAKKQIAARVARTQRELKRHRAQAQVFTDQIEVLGTHIYHLTLKAQGKKLNLPTAEELAQEAAQAEQVMVEVSANADLARSIEVGATSPTLDAEVDDILKQAEEFAGAAAKEAPSAAGAERVVAPASGSKIPASPSALPPVPQAPGRVAEPGKAKPELG